MGHSAERIANDNGREARVVSCKGSEQKTASNNLSSSICRAFFAELETDLFGRLFRRGHQLADGFEDHFELGVIFLFQVIQSTLQFCIGGFKVSNCDFKRSLHSRAEAQGARRDSQLKTIENLFLLQFSWQSWRETHLSKSQGPSLDQLDALHDIFKKFSGPDGKGIDVLNKRFHLLLRLPHIQLGDGSVKQFMKSILVE